MPRDRTGQLAGCPRARESPPGERGNSDGGDGAQWVRIQQSAVVFGAAVLRQQARRIFGIKAEQVHVDTTSFSVSGDYARAEGAAEPAVIAITYGYSRDHRDDLKQWMLALATTHDGDVPLFLHPLDAIGVTR